jgi:putative transcriptional regulator
VKSLEGKLLVASPHLPDENFFRSVVLIVRHDEEGAFGIVLNRPTENTIADIWGMLTEETCECLETINLGGPVAGPLMAVHTEEDCSETEILPGVYLATQREAIQRLVSEERYPFRIFSGYAGWGGGQLDQELDQGGWMTTEAHSNDIFADEEELWNRVSQHIGLEVMTPLFDRITPPDDPSLN